MSWKLTAADRREVLRRCRSGESYPQIAADYGLHQSAISQMARRRGIRRYAERKDKVQRQKEAAE